MGQGDGAGARFGHTDGMGRFAFRRGRRSPARHRDHGDGSAGAGSPAVTGTKGRGADKEELEPRSSFLPAVQEGTGISAGPARASPRLARDGERGRAPHRSPPCRGDFGSCRHTCAGRRPFPGLSIAQPAWVPTGRSASPAPAVPITRLGSAAKGDRYPAPRSPLPVMCGGEETRRCQNGPRGCRGDTGAAQHPQRAWGTEMWHMHPSGSPCCCQPRRARARRPNLWRSPDPKPIGAEVWR